MNEREVAPGGDFVLYWMIAARRMTSNAALDRALEWAETLGRPLVILEALRVDYPWASDRLHRFVLDGMRDHVRAAAALPVAYHPYVEPAPGAGKGLLSALAVRACVVVTDDFPCFFLPSMVVAAGRRLAVRLEAVDSNALLPMRSGARSFSAAAHYRRHVQKELRGCLAQFPTARPFEGRTVPRLDRLPPDVLARWPAVETALLDGSPAALARLPIDHGVPVAPLSGGPVAASAALGRFVAGRLATYHTTRDHPDLDATSRLSPYLHFGHVSAHEVFTAVMRHERWSPSKLAATVTGAREGWWGVSPGAETFLDQLVVWRGLAFSTCATRDDFDRFDSLPAWALATLAKHGGDARPYVYALDEFERAATHDELWNAAQRQLLKEGWFHNYLRMLWGKKILEWSATPREALHVMQTIMDRWSLDGRDPNSYAGYFWTLGRYDRPWPERVVYGTVRSMSSASTRRKVKVREYIARYGGEPPRGGPQQATLLPSDD